MADNPYVNKVVYGNNTVMDISDTTANESDVIRGKTFYKASGQRSTGTASLDEKMSYADNGVLGSKNMFPFPYRHRTGRESRGITYIVNDDGSVTFSGVATGESNFNFIANDYFPEKLKDKHLFMMGGLSQSIRLQLWKTGGVVANDTGDGADFTFSNSIYEVADSFNLSIIVDGGTDVSTPITIYPMLMLYTYSDTTYQPPSDTNFELTRSKMTYNANNVLGAKNLVNCTMNTTTVHDVQCKSWGDGTFTFNGTNDSTAIGVYLASENNDYADTINIPDGKYILSGGVENHKLILNATVKSGGSGSNHEYQNVGRDIEVVIDNTNFVYRLYVWMAVNESYDNVLFEPMIRVVDDFDDTFTPYAKTNKQLTDGLGNTMITLSKAEYDALSNTEKNDPEKVYYVYDETADGSMYYIERPDVTVSNTSTAIRFPASGTDSHIHSTSDVVNVVSDSGSRWTDITVYEGYVELKVSTTFTSKRIGLYIANN